MKTNGTTLRKITYKFESVENLITGDCKLKCMKTKDSTASRRKSATRTRKS